MLRLELLGDLRACVDGRVAIGPQTTRTKAKALLAYLYLKRHRYIPRDELLDALWPEADAPGSGRLKQTVLVLRDLIEPTRSNDAARRYILQRGGAYYFNTLADYSSDLEDFERELLLARSAASTGLAEAALAHYRRAFALRRGDLLPELAYEPWAAPDIARHRADYLEALNETGRLLAERGDVRAAIEMFTRAIDEEPLNEASTLELMRLMHREGRDVEALQAFERLQRLLDTRLHVTPSEDLIRLYELIRRRRSAHPMDAEGSLARD
jgi:LuxR family transcriptional regulator, maltose regulon positive regulatory protein